MRTLLTLLYLLLSLAGCNEWGSTTVTRVSVDGHDVVHSRVRTATGIATFECLASDSGACHFTLFPRDCTGAAASCAPVASDRLTLRVGETRNLTGLPKDVRSCVTADGQAMTSDCKPAPAG